jgi:hypothetical protein
VSIDEAVGWNGSEISVLSQRIVGNAKVLGGSADAEEALVRHCLNLDSVDYCRFVSCMSLMRICRIIGIVCDDRRLKAICQY